MRQREHLSRRSLLGALAAAGTAVLRPWPALSQGRAIGRPRARERGRRLRPPAGCIHALAHDRSCRAALMPEWWTYSLSDFLLFSPRIYYRLFELYNAAIWPLQILALMLGAAVFGLLLSGVIWRGRAIAAVLAACWLWVAWA